MTRPEILDRLRARAAEFRRLRASVDGAALLEEVIADLEGLDPDRGEKQLTVPQAAAASGFSSDHIGRLVRDGKLKNVGRKGAPRVLASELPRKPASMLDAPRSKSYDPASDARSLQRPAVRSDHGS